MILEFVETDGPGATEASLETVTFARDVVAPAIGDGAVHAVVVGALPDSVVGILGAYGVSEVHHATGEAFSAYGGAVWAAAVQAAHRDLGSIVVTAPGTPRGNEVLGSPGWSPAWAGAPTTSRSARPAAGSHPSSTSRAVSAAPSSWAGCANSKTILAINTDADAPVVTRANYAVIGDMHEVVPAINEEIRRRRG